MITNESSPAELRIRSVRLVRRAENGRVRFVPHGLLVVVGFVAMVACLAVFAGGAVEDAVARASRQALERVGASWARLEVSGQWVTLGGTPPTAAAAAEAFNAVEQARAATLFGASRPATRVIARFASPEDPYAAPPGAAEAAVAPTPGAASAAVVETCGSALADMVSRAKIEFATGSETIDPESAALLDSIAQAAGGCTGTLRIEGHTDNSGAASFNEELSRTRAEAVRAALVQRGLPVERLVVEGHGAARPIASNFTEEGRQSNRRIEIHVLPAAN